MSGVGGVGGVGGGYVVCGYTMRVKKKNERVVCTVSHMTVD